MFSNQDLLKPLQLQLFLTAGSLLRIELIFKRFY